MVDKVRSRACHHCRVDEVVSHDRRDGGDATCLSSCSRISSELAIRLFASSMVATMLSMM
jgi:hypothetical protein